MNSSIICRVKKFNSSEIENTEDHLAVEEPLELQLLFGSDDERIKKNISVTMRTPGNDDELSVGFLFTEGIIQNIKQVYEIMQSPFSENEMLITLSENEIPLIQKIERNFYTTSSCGVCGKSSIDAIKTKSVYKNTEDEIRLNSDLFYGLNDALRNQQVVFESTGGLHASALFDLEGNFLLLREDVGRHNALDKLIGAMFLMNRLPLNNHILLLSGRASFELVQKSAMAAIKVVAAVGAPSSLAVQLAKDSDITLIGFLRNKRFNVYSGEQRIKLVN